MSKIIVVLVSIIILSFLIRFLTALMPFFFYILAVVIWGLVLRVIAKSFK